MSADTAAKRYSAMNLASPWRGLNVVPDAAIPQGERQAVMYYYSGILFAPVPGTPLVIVPMSGVIGAPDTTYFIRIYDPYGNAMPDIEALFGLQVAQAVGTVGAVSFTIPGDYLKDYLLKDGLVEVYRVPRNRSPYLLFDKVFFLRRRRFISQGGDDMWQCTAYDPNFLISSPSGQRGRIVAYAATTDEASQVDFADDMLKAIMRQNIGSLATDTARDLSAFLDIQADSGNAPLVYKAFSNRVLLPVLNEICQASTTAGTYLTWDIVCTQAPFQGNFKLEFRTYINQRGIDHRSQSLARVLIGLDYGNLEDVEIDDNWSEEENYIRAGGKGEGVERTYVSSGDATSMGESPFNRREAFLNLSNVSDPIVLQDEIDAVLRAGIPRATYAGSLLDTDQARFDLDWSFGDYLTAQARGRVFDARVDAMVISFDRDNGEQIQAYLKGDDV